MIDNEKLKQFMTALISTSESRDFHGGILHVQVDDGNLEFDFAASDKHGFIPSRGFSEEEIRLGTLWNALSITERSVAVRYWWHPEESPYEKEEK